MDKATEPEPTDIQPRPTDHDETERIDATGIDRTRVLEPWRTTDASDAETAVIAPEGGPVTPAPTPWASDADELSDEALKRTKAKKDPERDRWWAILLALPLGVAGVLVGLAPWLLSGAHLPLQDLWETEATIGTMPRVLLPFSQYAVIQVFSYVIVGAAVAGILGRALRLRGWGLTLLELGVLIAQITAVAQTAAVLRDGLQDRFESTMYLAGLVIGAVLSVLFGVLVTLLVAAAPRAGALLGLTAGAIGMTAWVGTLLFPDGLIGGPYADLADWLPWIAPVLTGLAITWAGVNTVGRIIAIPFALAMIWIAPAVTTAVANALGNRTVFRSGSDLTDYAIAVFRSALLSPETALPPVIVAAVVATVGLVIRMLVGLLVKRTRAAKS